MEYRGKWIVIVANEGPWTSRARTQATREITRMLTEGAAGIVINLDSPLIPCIVNAAVAVPARTSKIVGLSAYAAIRAALPSASADFFTDLVGLGLDPSKPAYITATTDGFLLTTARTRCQGAPVVTMIFDGGVTSLARTDRAALLAEHVGTPWEGVLCMPNTTTQPTA